MKIKVIYRDYEVIEWEVHEAYAASSFGRCDTNLAEIHIDKTLAPQKRANVFLHEVMHAIWREMDLSDEDKEERIITALSNGICQVFRDNPDFYAAVRSD